MKQYSSRTLLFLMIMVVLAIFNLQGKLKTKDILPVPETRLPSVDARTVYFSDLRYDRSGTAIMHMMHSFAYAYAKNATYGGACGNSSHVRDYQHLLDAIGLSEVLPIACPDNTNTTTFRKVKGFTSAQLISRLKALGASNEWLGYLKQHAHYDPVEESLHPLVAVHIRRGDVDPCCHPDRYLPNSYYARLLDQQQSKHPNATIRIFSEKESFESINDLAEKYGAQLHLSGDIADVWKTMMVADTVITSRSSFSAVPQLLAKFRKGWHNPYMTDDPLLKEQVDTEINQLRKNCTIQDILPCQRKFFAGV